MVTMAFSLGGKRRPFTVSSNYAVGLPNGAAVTDARGTAWRATGGNQVSVNGVTDTTTSGVAKIVLVAGQIWQTTPSGWYFKTFPSDAWTFNSPGLSSASGTIVNVGETGGLVDPRAYVWTLSAAGVISVDSTADAATHDVTQIEYFNNQIWQNTIFGWYNKTLPTDAWAFSATAPGVAPPAGPVLLGAQLGDPATGDTTLFDQFRAAMNEAPSLFTTYAIPDECIRDPNGACIGAADWGPVIQWQNVANYSAHGINVMNGFSGAKPVTIPLVGVTMAQFANNYGHTADADFAAIQNGDWNYRFDAIYQAYVDHGFTNLISRPGFEMNGDWFAYSVRKDNSNAAAFAATFRYIATYSYNWATSKGITIRTCWNPGYMYDGAPGWRPDYTQFYPGDAYVDHIGIDTYGLCSGAPDDGPLRTYTDNYHFGVDDAIKFSMAHGKPLCFPEIGCEPGETTFMNNVSTRMVQTPACPVSFISIWNQQTGCNWPAHSAQWSTDSNSGTAWRNMVANIRSSRS